MLGNPVPTTVFGNWEEEQADVRDSQCSPTNVQTAAALPWSFSPFTNITAVKKLKMKEKTL